MKNQNLTLLSKGRFKEISNDFMTEGHETLQELTRIQ